VCLGAGGAQFAAYRRITLLLIETDDQVSIGHTGSMKSPKEEWAARLDAGPAARASLGRLVNEDGGRDEAENAYFESANDPQFVAIETAQRRFRGQFRRRRRHRDAKKRARDAGGF
jgi:hypothetical protein